MRGGFVLLGAGVVLDLVFHLAAAFTDADASHSGGVATTIHVLVLVGMAVTFGGLFQVAFRPQGAARRRETH
ncbi:MAG: hypothetical protein M3273_03870 [Actinomycetota bacterium]|nr:hypothetical protein [Actinomycetota bacterium]